MLIPVITTIDQLIKNINMGAGYVGYLEMVKSIQLNRTDWERFCNWKGNRYTRNCISSCEDYELLLMCWQAKHESPIHNYDSQEGWVKVLEGELTIESYHVDREEKCGHVKESVTLKEGESTYLNDSMGFHKVINSNNENTVSLHLNIEPVKQWEVFRSCRQALITVEPLLDSKSEDCE